MKAKLILLLALFTVGSLIHADVRLPNVLSNHMVLQRDLQVPVWGWADAGEKITVSFAGQKKQTTADKKGNWMIKLVKQSKLIYFAIYCLLVGLLAIAINIL